MTRTVCSIVLLSLLCCFAKPASAHFGMVIASDNIVSQDSREVELTLSFSHPFDHVGMELIHPKRLSVMVDGQTSELSKNLIKTTVMDHTGWQTRYTIKRPGVHHFAMEPVPYWEPAEDLSIIHYTKTIIAAFGADAGWDAPMGLPTEIVPLTRPFGNYAGNSFTGQVLVNGAPLAHAEVEVEYYNKDSQLRAPSDYHVTQLVKADQNGVFNFTCPWPGWWGFAALSEADYTLADPQGREKPVEIGAVLWIRLDDIENN
jgi:cobalt/nickel transport protein